MKSVMISIKPKWFEIIALGKTIEVRKSKPKLDTPFKCYIYMTKDIHFNTFHSFNAGKVIGEFVCDFITPLYEDKDACLTAKQIEEYSAGKTTYGWHISNLIIYGKPKELNEFEIECKGGCDIPYIYSPPCANCNKNKLTSPPQSWCYVEELSEV